ncbi:MAG: CBS domain-containing protein [Planctomycetota bacterium]|nr:CBS domain-containing protein [Planctomycetota bacterium]
MAKEEISTLPDDAQRRSFVRSMLEDVRALERMIEEGWIEKGVRRIGAEQEMFLVDRSLQPANMALKMLEDLPASHFVTELALFNLEANLTPLPLSGRSFSQMEAELVRLLTQAREVAAKNATQIVLCGILPTLDKSHLGLDSITPIPRYKQLNRIMTEQRGGRFQAYIKGLDELQTVHDNVMLEACNTSFQLHFQAGADEFARLYNLAQVIVAPLLAAGPNSPVLLKHRLWHETRVALFQQSLDTRAEHKVERGVRQRVSFGDAWVKGSILEIFRDDIARFRSLITAAGDESPLAMLDRGEVPPLKSLRLHNGTVYRWNRPCYGITDGKPHLRIECRVLPAGPTVRDEVANAAFFYGLMTQLDTDYGDVSKRMVFDDAKANFIAAARYGLQARFRWLDGKAIGADELILRDLLPAARKGLQTHGVDAADIDTYLNTIEARVQSGRTGAQWAFDSLAAMSGGARSADRYRALTAAMAKNQEANRPVHEWELAKAGSRSGDRDSYRTVGQLMTTDLFTVHDDDIVDLAASLMEWEHLRHVPVEDHEGRLLGLVTHRALMRILTRGRTAAGNTTVGEIMERDPVTCAPETSTVEAIALMRAHKIGSLPVVRDGRLVGIITEHDFFEISGPLLDNWLKGG